MAAKVRKDDLVAVIAGKDKGKTGKVKMVMPTENRVVVEGVGMVTKHTKPSMNSQGGLEKREAPIHISNVSLIDPKSGKPTRVGFKTLDDGRKVRIARPSGEQIDN